MTTPRWAYTHRLVLLFGALVVSAVGTARAQWPQWGGPKRDFTVETNGLAKSWPESGPTRLWHRESGDGYSAIAVDDGALYTMCAKDGGEWIIALDAKTGKTIWEHRGADQFRGTEFGPGPHTTPLIVGNRLFAIGATAVMHCLDKRTGKVLWAHDLHGEFGAPVPHFGYSCSPIAYKNMVIVSADHARAPEHGGPTPGQAAESESAEEGEPQSLMAFDQSTGSLVWKAQDYPIDYSSPILINFAGQDQLVLFMRKEIIGVDPNNGKLLWHQPCLPSPLENIATPLWNGEDLLFFSAAYDSGSRAIKLTRQGDQTVPRELWYTRKMRVHHGNAILIGDHAYGSSGDFASILFVALDSNTGERAWASRDLGKSVCIYADGKLIALEEHGELALATVSPEGLKVLARCKITEHQSWSAPTLAGTTLYVRDRKHIMAFDLGASANSGAK
jgi:outer membrane protein assembly factor BamB